ncbi:1,2-phenylacetyl-CoA epoxidase subunit PaaC [Nakamurella lactea]|uniref:1,2-phenylacetyl-CoA epoxidase subunit PaaC n=1 Tax=Nakamurella lactea TaxID=459515 RepID=UPI0003FC7001|nr:1,2-phenylacetyl-CoA epoxidase subunit PaaC [Nakamurella lactea]
MTGTPPDARAQRTADVHEYTLRLADDSLILSHRLAEWAAHAPQLEEDLALTNIGLDLLGQARALLTYAAELGDDQKYRDEDDLAYLRSEQEFRCCLLVQQPNDDDFGLTMVRQLFFSAYQVPLFERLSGSKDATLAAVAAKGVKEARYHLEHASGWVIRLGDGTEESHRRVQESVDRLWPYVGELFESDELLQRLGAVGIAAEPAALHQVWDDAVTRVLTEATLTVPTAVFKPGTGRAGRHSEALGFLLAEMQYLHRLHPGARW